MLTKKDTISAMNRAIRGSDDPYTTRENYLKHRDLAISIFGVNPSYYELTAVALYGKNAEILAK